MKLLKAFTFTLSVLTVTAYNLGTKFERIIKGKDAEVGQFPYQVKLLITVDEDNKYMCGGSLIHPEWILTAAHCVDGQEPKTITIMCGHTDGKLAETTRTAYDNNVTVHPSWNNELATNDIAVIKIDEVPLTKNTQTILLPPLKDSSNSRFYDEYAYVTGWGDTSDNAPKNVNNLQYGLMQITNEKVCVDTFDSFEPLCQMCGVPSLGTSVCEGDSGGALIIQSNKMQIGVASFVASSGCEKNYPAAFTRVTNYLDWIKSVTGVANEN